MVCLDEGGCGRSSVRLTAPPGALAPWVECFWLQCRGDDDRRHWRVVPDASGHVIYSMVSGAPRCAVVGSRSSYCDVDLAGRRVTIGARLRPGALSHLIRESADRLTDGAVTAGDVFGARGRELIARMAAGTPNAALRELGRFLAERFTRCDADFRLVESLRQARSVESAAVSLRISPRTLRAQTLRLAGLSPKRILRLRRLYRALRCTASPPLVWSDVAYRAGYADQAHLIREFRELLGEPPEQWRRRGAADLSNTTAPAVR